MLIASPVAGTIRSVTEAVTRPGLVVASDGDLHKIVLADFPLRL